MENLVILCNHPVIVCFIECNSSTWSKDEPCVDNFSDDSDVAKISNEYNVTTLWRNMVSKTRRHKSSMSQKQRVPSGNQT